MEVRPGPFLTWNERFFSRVPPGGSTSERMSDENENGRPGGRTPMTLKPRQGSVSAGVVKQSFSHGRTKTVVVETKRTQIGRAHV